MDNKQYRKLMQQRGVSVQAAIKMAVHLCRVAQHTSNREMQTHYREFIRTMWSSRNSTRIIVINNKAGA